MKVVVYNNYGLPDVLKIVERDKPIPKNNEVLIKVYATTVTATDCTFRRGKPYFSRLFTGLTKPKNQILGSEFVGEIESAGKEVKNYQKGDKVYGTLPGAGAYAEYICLADEKSTISKIPSNASYEESLSCCDGFLTALPFLRDKGKIKAGQKVLINGASGSVGSAALQLAKYFGAEVTGACSSASAEFVKSLGADKVIDYTKEDFTKSGEKYDIILDAVAKSSFPKSKNSLNKNGIFLEVGITLSVFPHVLLSSMFGDKKARIMATGLRTPVERTKDLNFIKELTENEKIKPAIDKIYSFEEIAEAHSYVDKGHKSGNVIITMQ